MRAVILAAVLLFASAPVAAQTVRCELIDWRGWGYGLNGTCEIVSQAAPAAGVRTDRTRFWPKDEKVAIFVATSPKGEAPWRGTLQYSSYGESFEIVSQRLEGGGTRLVLRTTQSGWQVVQTWRELTGIRCGGDKAVCDAAELVFRLNYASATSDDVAILTSALRRLSSIQWDREDDRDCANDSQGRRSLICLLSEAIEERMGRYHHSQPALELVRAAILQSHKDRVKGHALMNFNNDPATTPQDLRRVLEVALARARTEAAASK